MMSLNSLIKGSGPLVKPPRYVYGIGVTIARDGKPLIRVIASQYSSQDLSNRKIRLMGDEQ